MSEKKIETRGRKTLCIEDALKSLEKNRECSRNRYYDMISKWTPEQKEAYNEKHRVKYIKKDPALKKKAGRPCKDKSIEKHNNEFLIPFILNLENEIMYIEPELSPRLNY
jgi:hypothetical protein